MRQRRGRVVLWVMVVSALSVPAAAQDTQVAVRNLEKRVTAIEQYVRELQTRLDLFSKSLVCATEQQIESAVGRKAVLNPFSEKFVKVETNSGSLLVGVSQIEQVDRGYRLVLQIGNPSSVGYGDLGITLRWGRKWDQSYAKLSYEKWRSSLGGGKYAYPGQIPPGSWVEVAVDMVPADYEDREYIECEIEAGSVLLQKSEGIPR